MLIYHANCNTCWVHFENFEVKSQHFRYKLYKCNYQLMSEVEFCQVLLLLEGELNVM